MKLIIGLGNPREEYRGTRHNAGFLVAEALQKIKLPAGVIVRKSDVFMNDSGTCINELIHQYKVNPTDLYVIHDDLDIPLGSYKIQFGTGPKVHNGVNSIETELGTKDFWRVRVGIENRGNPTSRDASRGKDYVLEEFIGDERKLLDGVIEKICKEISKLASL